MESSTHQTTTFCCIACYTGVTMDPDTGKVNAPEEVWAEFYMKNKREYKSIRKEGCDHFHILCEVFGGTTIIGDMHRASTQLPPTSDEERELEEAFINRGVNSYVEVIDDENEDVGGEPNNWRQRVAESSNSRRRKDPKHSRIEKYEAYMDKWSNTMEQLSGESISRQKILGNCLGAIDGTHVLAWAPSSIQTSFRGRKVIVTQNVMLACDFDMLFTFVYTGWEGTANDSRVFIDALTRHENNFPKPYGDQFYLVDSGYPNMPGFLALYRGRRYHLRDYWGKGDFNDQEPIPIDSSQTAQMGSIRDEIASNMWNDYMVTNVGFDFVMLAIIGLYLIVLFTVLVIAKRGFDELLLMIRRLPTRKSKAA
ncbi:hypothetical protein ZIOFF_031967 [Zingiber officinale]|uniref:DDE Tnp4 domain-containing protein n=1 Tax=Zingiber officinale TaxID=94328 RepID=A0A8J5GN51_ZINOF|nr:hypothetical protein ZIOFF_031967 [Zingiber officinale]